MKIDASPNVARRMTDDDRALGRLLADHPADGYLHLYQDPPARPFGMLYLDGLDAIYVRGENIGAVLRNALSKVEVLT